MPVIPWEEYARQAAGIRDATLEGGASPAQTGIPTDSPEVPRVPMTPAAAPPAAAQATTPRSQPVQPSQPVSPPPAEFTGAGADRWRPLMEEAEQKYALPGLAQILDATAMLESNYDPDAIGDETKYGRAKGLYQLLDSTAADYNVDPMDPVQATDGTARHYKRLYSLFGGDWRKVIAAYIAGEGNVSKAIAKYGDDWLEKGAEFNLGEHTFNRVKKMEPVILALEAQPEPTTYASTDPMAANRETPAPPPPADKAGFLPEDVSAPYANFFPYQREELDPLREPSLPPAPTNTTGMGGPDSPLFVGDDVVEPGEQGYRIPTGGYGTALKMGAKNLAGAATGFVDTITGTVLNAPPLFEGFRELVRESVDEDAQTMRPELQRARAKKWFTTEDPAWADLQAWAVQFTEQTPNLAAAMIPPVGVARVVYAASIAKGLAPAVARKAAEKAAAVAGGVAEGTIVTGFTRDQIEGEILDADHAQLMETLPQYRELIELHGDTPEGQRLAKLSIARDVAEGYSLLAGAGSYALGHWAGKWLGRCWERTDDIDQAARGGASGDAGP